MYPSTSVICSNLFVMSAMIRVEHSNSSNCCRLSGRPKLQLEEIRYSIIAIQIGREMTTPVKFLEGSSM